MDIVVEKGTNVEKQEEIEIRLSDIVQFLRNNFWKMLIGATIGLFIGALYAFSKPNMYTVETTVMPEYQGGATGSLATLSAFSGLGFDNTQTSDAIRPDLYPDVLGSIPFALYMLNQKVYSKELNATTTLQEYFDKTSTVSFVSKVLGLFAGNEDDDIGFKHKFESKGDGQAIQLTKKQDGLVKAVFGSVTPLYNKKTGVLTITAIVKDPFVSTTVAQASLNYLTNYITAYRTDKARKRVLFLTNQMQEAQQKYQKAEYALSSYRDRNRSLYLNTAKLDEQRLQTDYILTQSVYNDLAKQLELAKIKVVDDTPTFKTLEPPVVPLRKSGPKRTLIMLGCLVVGGIIAFGIVLVRQILSGTPVLR